MNNSMTTVYQICANRKIGGMALAWDTLPSNISMDRLRATLIATLKKLNVIGAVAFVRAKGQHYELEYVGEHTFIWITKASGGVRHKYQITSERLGTINRKRIE